ncbi:MAG: DUF4493 domain-containing protein [Bacteroidales bacterium]|nr:DUF4493 domain-containing protein [Bacteroidales bacterium]
MKKLISILASGLVLGAVSCVKQEMAESQGEGVLCVDMSVVGQTKALSEDQLYNTAEVNIYKADYSGLVRSYVYSEIPSPLYLAADKYRVDVIAGEAVAANPAIASWDSRSYKGSQAFEIIADQVTTVQVVANVNNAVTKVSFDPTVAENFTDGYTMTMTLSDEASSRLVYDSDKSGAEGYYIVDGLFEPSLTWTFTGTLAKDGSSFTKTGVIENVQAGKLYNMNLKYTIKDGELDFSLSVDRTTEIVDDTIIFEPVSTGLAPSSIYEIWATRATLHADVDVAEGAGKKVQFGYSSDGGATWSYIDAVNDSEGTWKADITGLAPSTEYTYALVLDGVHVGDTMSFTTEAAPNLPNASFEYVSKVSGQSYYKFYDPDCGVEEGSFMFWGSGNGEGSEGVSGSADMGITITAIDTADKIHGNQSVVAQTSSMVGMLAAGNLFTGQFAGLVGTSGGKVNFGRPWTSRPSAMRIWCKYSTGKFNIVNNNNLGVTKDDYDRAQIKVAIGTWDYKKYGGTKDSPVHINTTDESTFVDYYTDPNTIANGDVVIYNDGYMINNGEKVTAATTGWIEYVIPLDYRKFNAYPTHIVVSCAASQYGDYFTGYDKTKLWIDAVELIYE